MQNHIKIYLQGMKFTTVDWIPCEICEQTAIDIHHIDARGMGGTDKDTIDNLMALCRGCHTIFGDIKDLKESLKTIHKLRIKEREYKSYVILN